MNNLDEVEKLLSNELIQKFNAINILNDYRKWYELAKEVFEKEIHVIKGREFRKIILCGMGGSAAACDAIRDCFKELDIVIVKDYHLPSWVQKNDLVIAVSYSGNTEETLSCYIEAYKKGLPLVTVSSGGLLEKVAKRNNVPHNSVLAGLAPRAAFPQLFYTLVNIFYKIDAIEKKAFYEARNSINQFSNYSKKIFPETDIRENVSKQIAAFIYKSFPTIYGSNEIKCVVERFERMVSENGKWHAMSDTIPELCHNEIVSYELYCPQTKIIMLRTKSESKEIFKRFEIVKDIIRSSGHELMELKPECDKIIEAIVAYFYFLDVSTIYLAVMNRVDPSKTASIEYLKRRLGEELNYTKILGLESE
ncbi:MAG: bifunctional phosphoglucose/phosphomannose isomerase [Nitrososphaeria archaeon]|nr:bifunctional phosphoglucose/phosphomannose isomerase [Nitrososphaeria archaeon]